LIKYIFLLLAVVSLDASSATSADYKVTKGKLHQGGKVHVEILPVKEQFKVQMTFAIKKKKMVPVPAKLLKGDTIMEFPDEFRTEKGYKHLEEAKIIDIPKARLHFIKRIDLPGQTKQAYLLKVLPTNKKTEIEILYHPKLPAVGWEKVEITFISKIPLLNGYEVKAELK
jgi:hypothetical protein